MKGYTRVPHASAWIFFLAGLLGSATDAQGVRGGWEDPPGGWSFMFEGDRLPDAAGFSHSNDSDAWDPGLDPAAVRARTAKGLGDTEDGITPSPDARVVAIDDKQVSGANSKFLFTRALRAKGSQPRLFETGVTFIARWRLVSPTTSYNNEYSAGNVGVAEDMDNVPDWGVGAYYASSTGMAFVPPELGSHPIPVSSSNSFHAAWVTAIYDPANRSNVLVNVYLDGASEPTITFTQTGWDTASRAPVDNVYFGLSRSAYVGALELDYLGAKVGVYAPVRAGLRAEAGPDRSVNEGESVELDGAGSQQAESYSWAQVVHEGDPVVAVNNADQAVANFIAPQLDQGVTLSFMLTVRKGEEEHTDTANVTVKATNAPVTVPPNFSMETGHLLARLSWDTMVDANLYWIGVASQEPGQDKSPFAWLSTMGTSYLHDGLLNGWTYYYKLKAANAYGEGPESQELSVTAVVNLARLKDVQPFARVVPVGQMLSRLNDAQTTGQGFYTNDGVNYAERDWYGYTWFTPNAIDRVVYYASESRPDGGWWRSLTVEYSDDGGVTWHEPPFVTFSPDYSFENAPAARPDYGRYVLAFPAVTANALRIAGTPGGSSYYTGIVELEVYGPAFENEVYVHAGEDQDAVKGDSVTLSSAGTIHAESYLWRQIAIGNEPVVELFEPTSPVVAFVAPAVTGETVLTFELEAQGVGGTKTDRVRVRVVPDQPPASPQWRVVSSGLGIVYLSWEPSSGAETYAVLRSEIPGDPGTVVAAGLTEAEFLDEDIFPGVHFYTARAVNPAGAADSKPMPISTRDFDEIGLDSRDIGNPKAGSTAYDPRSGSVTVAANGTDIWGFSDSFRFDYTELSGDFEVIVEAESLAGPNAWGKLGPMIRDSLEASSVHSYVCSTVMTALALQGRTLANSNEHFNTIIPANAYEFPIYLRLKRAGTTLTGLYRRPDGEWHTFSPSIMVLPAMLDPVYAGVAVTSHQAGALATGSYSHLVSVRQPLLPAVAFRKMPLSFRPGEPVTVKITVGVDPTRPPDALQILEVLPPGTVPIETGGGELLGDVLRWSLPSKGVQNRTLTYTLSVSPDVVEALSFSGEIVCSGAREPIPGASTLYRSPSPVTDVTVEVLLSAYLTWSASPPVEGIIAYHVYRSADGGEWQRVASSLTETSWTDPYVQTGVTYSYKVTAETFYGAETELGQTPATTPVHPSLNVRECEDYDADGGAAPGGPGADGIAARGPRDLVGTDYFYQNTAFPWYDQKIPNLYRPDDVVEIVSGEGASGWSVRNLSAGDWFRYTFRNVPAGDVKIVLRAAGDGASIVFLWDEVALDTTVIPKTTPSDAWWEYALPPFPSLPGDHVLRVRVLQGPCHLDRIGIGYDWSRDSQHIFFDEDFESFTTTQELESAGWVVVNTSGDPNGAWQLSNVEEEPAGPGEADLPGVNRMYMIANGDLTFDVELDEELISPMIDCRNFVKVRLRFSKNVNIFEDDPDGDPQLCDVDLRAHDDATFTWSDWINVYHHDRAGGDDRWPEDIGLSAVADLRQVQLRWHFYDTYYDYWFAVDNIAVSGVPRSSASGPIALSHNWVTLSWEPFGSGRYTIQYADSLANPQWRNLPGDWPIARTLWSGEDAMDIPMRFYRVVGE
ncbi:MAG: DUF5010 C-terminal domain-containing protein [bacterium]|nr:DUF5010 C-terminal domain-containing protein [bacterium]